MNMSSTIDRYISAGSRPTAESLFLSLSARLCGSAPEEVLWSKSQIAAEIIRLKEERNALILGHNYMEPALYYTIPDHTGDSLELSRIAAQSDRDVILFCGVKFMAETAVILNPDRTVLLPSMEAGCSLASSITAEDVRELKRRFPGVPVVVYINTYADVKAEADICCTSGNAAGVIASLDAGRVIFLPDEFLAANIARETGRRLIVPSHNGEVVEFNGGAEIIGWNGRCEVHERFTVEDIAHARRQSPGVVVLSHPECSPEVVEASDFSGSTSAMIRHVAEHPAPAYLLLTECAMGDNIAAEYPERELLRLCSVRCPHMGEITLEQVLASLRENRHVIELDEEVRRRAERSVRRMLELGA
jgi:quinolinate synthase